MNQIRGELRLHRAHREEAVGDGAERVTYPMAVREAGEEQWHGLRLGLDLRDERLDEVPERRLDRRASPTLRLDPLEVVIGAPEVVGDLRLHLPLRVSRKNPAVDGDLTAIRDHVALLRRLDHRGRERGAEQRL